MLKLLSFKSVRKKLLFIIWAGSTATLFLACGCFIVFEVSQFNKDLTKDIKIISSFIADKSASAIMFNNPAIAEDALLVAASTDTAIVNAVIYDAKSNVIATYSRDIDNHNDYEIPVPQQSTSFVKNSHLHFFGDIDMYSDHLGSIYIQADRHALYDRIQSYIVIVAFIMAVSLLFIAVISFILQKLVSVPILALVASAKQVSEKKDYSIRVKKQSEDELGVLAETLNEMLSRIQQRDNALSENEEKYRTLVDNIPGVSYRCGCTAPWAMEFISDEIENLSGYPATDFIQNKVRSYGSIINPEDQRISDRIALESIAMKEPYAIEYRIFTADGDVRWVYEKGQGIFNEQGEVQYLDGVIVDITESKQAEQEREKLFKTLEYKNHELQDIVYSASHDLRSPLVNIEGFSNILETDCGELTNLLAELGDAHGKTDQIETLLKEGIPESLGFITRSAKKMASLLDGLLQVSRVGSVEITSELLNMNKIVEEVLGAMEHQINESNAKVEVDSLPDCVGDVHMMDHVLTNLVGNAVKYLVPAKESEIRISGKVENGMSIYCVQDNGIGIAAGHQSKVFEIFHRLDPGGPVGGEGLGLTIVTRIIDRLGGKIWVESEAGKGSKFFVSLPTAKA